MRINIFFAFLFVFHSLIISGQETKFNFANVSDHKSFGIPYDFSAYTSVGQFILGSTIENKIDLYDSKLNLIRSKAIINKNSNEKKLGIWKCLFISNNLNIISINTQLKKDTNTFFVKKINADLSEESAWEKLEDVPCEKLREIAGYKINNSQDGSKVLLNTGVPPRLFKSIAGISFSELKSTNVTCYVYDNRLKPIWSKSINLGDDNREYNLSNFQISNDAKVAFIGKTLIEKQEQKKFHTDHKYVLFVYDYLTEKLNKFDIVLENKYITHVSFLIDNINKKIFISGYYSNKNLQNIIGTYIKKLDMQSYNFEVESSSKFDDVFLLKYLTQKKIQKNKELKNEYVLKQFIQKENGELTLISEFCDLYVDRQTTTTFQENISSSSGGYDVINLNTFSTVETKTSTTRTYKYRDIIASNFNSEAKVTWNTSIQKKQHSVNDYGLFSSFAFSVVNNKLYFLFDDNEANYIGKSDKIKSMPSYYNAITALACIDENGNLNKTIAVPSLKYRKQNGNVYPILPQYSFSCKNKFILMGYDYHKFQLGTLTIE